MTTSPTSAIAPTPQKTALVVASGGDIDELLTSVFVAEGWNVQRVVDNQDALSLARTKPFDLIITGRKTCGPEDIDFLRKIRSARAHLRLIILTDQWTPGDIIAAMRGQAGAARWMLLLEGLVSIAAGLVTFFWPGLTALVLLYVIAAWALVAGVLEIVVAVRLRKRIRGEWWLALSGILSVITGGLMMWAPDAGALALVLWIGAYAVVFGALLIGLALRLRGWRVEAEQALSRAA